MSLLKIQSTIPEPSADERPTAYADRVGQWYASVTTAQHKKRFGQYLTPVAVADFMARLSEMQGEKLRVLDPGAGAGVLGCALCEYLASRKGSPSQLTIDAYETDPVFSTILEKTFSFLQTWLQAYDVSLLFTIREEDFVVRNAEILEDSKSLFPNRAEEPGFDIVISNPPYFKLKKSDPRARAAAPVVHGQPNIYALFMAVSAYMLVPDGEFVFITPRSFASGPYFQLFRERFFAKLRPELVHVFTSRRDAFSRDAILQENVIMKARRVDGWTSSREDVTISISSSVGVRDLSNPRLRKLSLNSVLDLESTGKVLRIPVSEEDDKIARLVNSWSGSLHAYGLEISTGPVVPFRAVHLLSKTGEVPDTHAPLLWMQNVSAMKVEWPTSARNKEQYIRVTEDAMPLLVADRTYVLLRRFSAKEQRRRLTAAPLVAGSLGSALIGLENHLNYVHRPGGTLTEDEAWGLAILYNTSLLDTYFRTLNGNTQVSATELRSMPLPPLKTIVKIGRTAKAPENPLEEADRLVTQAFEDIQQQITKVAVHG